MIDGVQPSILYILLGTFIALIGCEISYRVSSVLEEVLPMSLILISLLKPQALASLIAYTLNLAIVYCNHCPERISNYIVNLALDDVDLV